MIQRTTVLFLELLLGLIVVALIGLAAVAWRLSEGPIEVAWARAYLERALSDEAAGHTTRVGNTTLAWSGWERAFGLIADDVVLIDPDGAVRARVGSISVSLSPSALLVGRLAPKRIEILQPTVTAVRRLDGSWTLLSDVASSDAASSQVELSSALRSLVSGDSRITPLAYLREIEVQRATVRLVDDARDLTLTLSGVAAGLSLTPTGTDFRLRGRVAWPQGPATPITVNGSYETASDRLSAVGEVSDILPPALGALDARLERLEDLEAPVSARIEVLADLEAAAISGTADLNLGEGRVRIPEVNADWLQVGGGSASVSLSSAGEQIRIDGSLDVEGVPMAAELRARRDRSGYAFVLDAGVSNLPVNSIERYWPPALADGARVWVTSNLESGHVPAATIRVEGWIDPESPASAQIDALSGRIDFSDVNTHYLRPLPPVLGSSGMAAFDGRRMVISILDGQLDDLSVESSTVTLLDIGLPLDERATIDVAVRGPVKDALRLLDREPLGYPSEIGLDVEQVDGRFGARLRFELPLDRSLQLSDVGIAASANLQDAIVPGLIGGESLRAADLELDLTGSGMTLRGTGDIAGTAAAIFYERTFQETKAVTSRSTVEATPDAATLARFGLDLGDMVEGPIAVSADVVTQRDGRIVSDIDADLQGATLRFDPVGWQKPADAVGILRARVDQSPTGLLSVPDFEVRAADLVVAGSVGFPGDGGLIADLSTFRLGDTDAAGRIEQLPDGSLRLAMEGPEIDLSAILDDDEEDDDSTTVLDARFAADRLRFSEAIVLDDSTLSVRLTGPRIEQLGLAGGLLGTPLRLAVQPVAEKRLLTLETEDAGAVLAAFDITDTIRGGKLRVDGEMLGDGFSDELALSTRIDEFRINDAPVFARLLSVASFTGLFDALSGDGIRFARATGEVRVSDQELTIANGLAYGPGLGVKVDGRLGRETDEVEISGLLAPAYSLSRLIDVVPVIGELITGGEGEGLLATAYTIRGTVEEPVITVNPLTALAPGFVRDLLSAASQPGDGPVTAPIPTPGLDEDRGR